MIQLLIKQILRWLQGITAIQWAEALSLVLAASIELQGKTGAEKRAWVINTLATRFPKLNDSALNVLVELAVSFSKKKTGAA